MGGAQRPNVHFRWLTDAIGWLALTSSRHAKTTLLILLLATIFFGSGVQKITTNVDVADVLPRGDYNTTAAKQLTSEFKSAFTMQVTLQFHVDPEGDQWAEDNREKLPNRRTNSNRMNITDEVYIRAIAQAVDFIKAEDPLVCCSIGIADLYKLVNWTLAGGQDADPASWALPGTDAASEQRYDAVHRGANAAILDALDALASPHWTTTAQLLMPAADETESTAEIGRRAINARDHYIEWATANPDVAYQVFTGDNFPRLTVELPVANAHSSALVKEDFSKLLPIIAGFILVVLFIAFRNLGAVVIAFTALAMGTIWTYGIEGFMGIALNPLNLTLMPLIMGVGIDYAIHVTNEFQEHKSKGLSHQAAFREVGHRGGMALFIATATTIVGLVIMIYSPSALIVEFGILATFSMLIMFGLVLTFIPAALTLWPRSERMGASFRPSRVIPAMGRLVTQFRGVVLIGVLVLLVAGTLGSAALKYEAFGDPGRNYLRSDPIRKEHEQGLRWFYEVQEPNIKANVISFEGDLTDPRAHAYMRAIEVELKRQPRIIADTLRTIPFLMETWLTVKDGASSVADFVLRENTRMPNYPDTQQEIKSEFDALYATPMRELGSIFTNGPTGGYRLGVMTFSTRAATFEEAKEAWDQVWRAINNRNVSSLKPADMKVAFVGNTATNYLFVAKEVPWLAYMGIASTAGLALLVVAFFRSWRAFWCIMLINFATTAWWLGILPLEPLDIGLAITLVLPLIFISAIGTDYAVHMAWAIREVGDAREVFRTTGKAVLFSWMSTAVPFAIFMYIQDLAVRKTMIANVIAITLIFLCTMLVVPAFYPVQAESRPPVSSMTAPAAPPPTRPAPLTAVRRAKGPAK